MKSVFKQKFFSLFILITLICCQNVFSQFDSKYQREFVISISQDNPDLNPHTASYSTEAQLINGLYEGLFTYEPRTLQPIPAICESFKTPFSCPSCYISPFTYNFFMIFYLAKKPR